MTTPAASDERIVRIGPVLRMMRRPELGAFMGAIVVFVMFTMFDHTPKHIFPTLQGMARWTDIASTYGIVAVAVALLMIGGEFDLSSGVMVGSSALLSGMLITEAGWSVWPAIIVTILAAAGIGFINGWLVVTTKLPSFIVTLAMFFSLRGINLGLTKLITNTVRVAGVDKGAGYESAHRVLAAEFWQPYGFKVAVIWWLALTAIATWILTRTRFGNWIFAVGGDANAARNTGVPVKRTKIFLFMYTSVSAALVGMIDLMRLKGVQAGQGIGDEFTFIIAAVVGGCLLTGGYGSAIGASIGASIIGMAFIGIAYAGWNTDWTFLFLGVILFIAVMVNNAISKRAQGATRRK